ncbi:response regulator transcription factor [Parafannyhessea umbonata]|jgi:DNA-binding response OmpR family regulator|uniref:DNA-binding response regulator, OmpR family, contains REC and winged-helix (WHTH) domain n=1 Tax=Parafannyhessea umbonata TaxID=604330 RepID=A0A1H1LIB4_9ACTN|nr:response regulator transcription factor [Parafannyhessea umbonata]SDC36845.1 DNA-binding response regulator, OmpR family, contains REC and winged-helix (wHTH) domain [Parafannyhessea umbonata]SDR74304.1 DNA-binding response regulator, OmpR family, contains REC and winged-helix (wHTH) domain [Parafannyhessea umbonata]
MNILVVEDERNLADAIVRIVSDAGFNCEAVYDGNAGLTSAESGLYDAVIMDVMLPGMDGIQIVRELRHQGNSIPVLMLTARTSTSDKVEGLDAGADDYMTKPFEAAELLARLRALTRRQGDVVIDTVTFADLTLDLETHDLSCDGREVHLSGKEFEVLKMLMSSNARVVSKQDLLTRVWGADADASENSVEAYISFLRKKLTHVHSKVQITTLRMLGYRLEAFDVQE